MITTFFKWYKNTIFNKKRKCIFLFFGLFLLNYLLHFGFYALKTKYGLFEYLDFFSLFNPFLIFSLLGLFFWFEGIHFENRFVSYVATGTLFVYVIHENFLLRTITRVDFYNWFKGNYSGLSPLLPMFLCGLFMFVCGFALAVLYKETFGRLTRKIADSIYKVFSKLFLKFVKEDE